MSARRTSSSLNCAALVCILVIMPLLFLLPSADAFTPKGVPQSSRYTLNTVSTFLSNSPGPENGDKVKIGSEKYYEGFLSRSVDEEPEERVTGDALLGPTFKFAGGVSVVVVALLVAFLASNGLL